MIVFLCTALLPAGGVQRAGRLIAAVLAEWASSRELAFRCFSLNDPAGTQHLPPSGRSLWFSGFGRSKLRFLLAAARLAAGRKIEVVAVSHPNLAPVAAAIKALVPSCRVVVFTHGIEVWTRLSPVRRGALRSADLVIAPSSATGRCLVEVQGVEPERVRCVPWAVDVDLMRGEASLRAVSSGPMVLSVGRLAPDERYKGVDHLLRAVSSLVPSFPDVRLVVVGDGDDRPRLETLAHEIGIASHVRFLPALADDALAACYRSCDLFAMPSRGEGFGLVFLEAMAFGKPVIAGAHGGTPEVVEDGQTGFLVEHGNVEALREALERLLADGGLRRHMGERGRRRVQSEFLFDHFRDRLLQALHTSVGDGGARPVRRPLEQGAERG